MGDESDGVRKLNRVVYLGGKIKKRLPFLVVVFRFCSSSSNLLAVRPGKGIRQGRPDIPVRRPESIQNPRISDQLG